MDGIDREWEFLLSDHPAAVAERARVYGEHEAPAHLRDLSDRVGVTTAHALERLQTQQAEPDHDLVVRLRRELDDHVRASVDPDYRYPHRYLGADAGRQPNLLALRATPHLPAASQPNGPNLAL